MKLLLPGAKITDTVTVAPENGTEVRHSYSYLQNAPYSANSYRPMEENSAMYNGKQPLENLPARRHNICGLQLS